MTSVPVSRFGTAVLRFVMAGVVAACGGGSGTGPGPGPSETMSKAGGDNQMGDPGLQLTDPLKVFVSRGGQPIAGRTVTWQVTGGGSGSVNPTTSTTEANGTATTTVTLPNGGAMTIQASASGVNSVSFTASVIGLSATVEVRNNEFVPSTVTINAGGTVTFNWPSGSQQHNLIPDGGKDRPRHDAIENGPFTVNVGFANPGRYDYHCSVHGTPGGGMNGTVMVR